MMDLKTLRPYCDALPAAIDAALASETALTNETKRLDRLLREEAQSHTSTKARLADAEAKCADYAAAEAKHLADIKAMTVQNAEYLRRLEEIASTPEAKAKREAERQAARADAERRKAEAEADILRLS